MKILRFLNISVVVILMVLSSPARAEEYAVLLKGMDNPYWKAMEEGFRDTGKSLGISIYLQGAQSDSAAEEQLNICETMILRKPQALIVGAVNAYNLLPCLKKAQSQNIPVINIDSSLDKKVSQEAGVDIPFSIGSDNYAIGRMAAEYLKGKTGKVLVIEGLPGSLGSEGRTKGFKDNIKNMQIAASVAGDWDRLKAANIARDVLTAHPDLTTIYAANDTMALGAVETLRSLGRNDIVVVGTDGTTDAVKAIKEGRLTASIAQLPYLMAKVALEKTRDYLARGSRPAGDWSYNQYVDTVIFDRAALEKPSNPLMKYVR